VIAEGERKDRWLEHWSQPINDGIFAGGRIEQYTDITDRKHAEMAEIEQRQFAEALRNTAEALNSTLEIDTVLDRILENIDTVVPNDAASIVLIEDEDLNVERSRGRSQITTQEIMGVGGQLQSGTLLEQMRQTQAPVMIPSLTAAGESLQFAGGGEMQSYIGAPIILQDEVIGFINIFCHVPNCFDQDSVQRLTTFAAQAATAIQNARLYRRSKELAAVQERQRLARELHDSVSQTLFSAQTMAEASLRQWNTHPEDARALLDEVYRLLVGALAEMRVLLLELRPASLTQVGIKQLFEQYLQAALANQHIQIQFDIAEIPILPADVQIALYRIVQEAVNNVVKHAGADTITVSARRLDDRLQFTVSDDGRGFSSTAGRSTSLGINIMRERAEGIGAHLQIESEAGQGTRVMLSLPIPVTKG
jgi:signal transduction histidine kinase